MPGRCCQAANVRGEPCGAPPLRDGDLCFQHSPAHAEEAAEARRLGGLRRRREGAVAGAFELDSLNGPAELQRALEIAMLDTLVLENSVPRNRTIMNIVLVALRLPGATELEDSVQALEQAVIRRNGRPR